MNAFDWRRGAMLLAAAVITAGGAVGLASCGDGDDDSKTTPTADSSAPRITIEDARARATVNDTSGVFFIVKNAGGADKLVGAWVDAELAGEVQLHETRVHGTTSQMHQVESIEVPANGQAELKPGSYHVMLLDVKKPLSEGETIQVRLSFEKAGEMTIDVPVMQIGMAGSMDAAGSPGTGQANMGNSPMAGNQGNMGTMTPGAGNGTMGSTTPLAGASPGMNH